MNTIRPFTRDDIPQVTSLYELVMRSGSRTPPPGLGPYFEQTFLDHPWIDPEIPSLVSVDSRMGIVGFIGSSVRRLRFDDQPIRMAVSGPLVSDPAAPNKVVGALLLGKFLAGPQELTITDGATEPVQMMWERLGGETLHLSCLRWTRVFRPWRFNAQHFLQHDWMKRLRPAAQSPGRLEHAASVKPPADTRASPSGATGEALTPDALVEHLREVTRSRRLYPAYDQRYLAWLFEEMEKSTSRGRLCRFLVRSKSGRVAGWYVYYLRRGEHCQVFQVAATHKGADDVLGHLFSHAEREGAAALEGRMEPQLLEPISRRNCILQYRGALPLMHSRIQGVLHAVRSGQALLTRLEGEAWMGHRTEPFA